MLRIVSLILVSFILGVPISHAAEHPHWGYSGEEGPQHWGSLSPAFGLCSTGNNQSPIDLDMTIEADLTPIQFDYKTGTRSVLNNGHTIQVNYEKGSTIILDGHRYELKQFHFHSPSENHIAGKSFPMEGHLVHADEKGNLAVIAVLFEKGEANPIVERVWNHMPTQHGKNSDFSTAFSVLDMLPGDRSYYRFNGSLTTPPCTEGVLWMVMKQPVTVSAKQIERFQSVMMHDNNRPVQPVNARAVLR